MSLRKLCFRRVHRAVSARTWEKISFRAGIPVVLHYFSGRMVASCGTGVHLMSHSRKCTFCISIVLKAAQNVKSKPKTFSFFLENFSEKLISLVLETSRKLSLVLEMPQKKSPIPENNPEVKPFFEKRLSLKNVFSKNFASWQKHNPENEKQLGNDA